MKENIKKHNSISNIGDYLMDQPGNNAAEYAEKQTYPDPERTEAEQAEIKRQVIDLMGEDKYNSMEKTLSEMERTADGMRKNAGSKKALIEAFEEYQVNLLFIREMRKFLSGERSILTSPEMAKPNLELWFDLIAQDKPFTDKLAALLTGQEDTQDHEIEMDLLCYAGDLCRQHHELAERFAETLGNGITAEFLITFGEGVEEARKQRQEEARRLEEAEEILLLPGMEDFIKPEPPPQHSPKDAEVAISKLRTTKNHFRETSKLHKNLHDFSKDEKIKICPYKDPKNKAKCKFSVLLTQPADISEKLKNNGGIEYETSMQLTRLDEEVEEAVGNIYFHNQEPTITAEHIYCEMTGIDSHGANIPDDAIMQIQESMHRLRHTELHGNFTEYVKRANKDLKNSNEQFTFDGPIIAAVRYTKKFPDGKERSIYEIKGEPLVFQHSRLVCKLQSVPKNTFALQDKTGKSVVRRTQRSKAIRDVLLDRIGYMKSKLAYDKNSFRTIVMDNFMEAVADKMDIVNNRLSASENAAWRKHVFSVKKIMERLLDDWKDQEYIQSWKYDEDRRNIIIDPGKSNAAQPKIRKKKSSKK